jgi:hypothetical protein
MRSFLVENKTAKIFWASSVNRYLKYGLTVEKREVFVKVISVFLLFPLLFLFLSQITPKNMSCLMPRKQDMLVIHSFFRKNSYST